VPVAHADILGMAKRVLGFRDLIVWQKAMTCIDQIDCMVDQLTSFQRWWVGLQILRAALSIASNIAEGHDAGFTKLYLRRLEDARGSTREVETQLLVIQRRTTVPRVETDRTLSLVDEIGRMLRTMSSQLRAQIRMERRKS